MKAIFKNSKHETSFIVNLEEIDGEFFIRKSQLDRLEQKLCNSFCCRWGGQHGVVGVQENNVSISQIEDENDQRKFAQIVFN